MTGECRLLPPFNLSFSSEWHSKQTLSCFATIIPPKLDAWASWHVRHSPPLKGSWLTPPATSFIRSLWQSAHREAPVFRRSFFSSAPCAAWHRAATPRQDRFMDVFLDETGFRVRVATVADLVFPVLQDPREIGPVGIVAGGALPLGERRMLRFRLLARLHLRVAGVAQVRVLGREEPLVLRGMRHVAGEAPFPLRHGGVALRHRFPLLPVAFEAEAVPVPDKEFRVPRSMRIVAGEAFPSAEGVVEDRSPRLQLGFIVALVAELPAFLRHREGRLGIGRRVARVAAFLRHGIVRALLQKRFSVRRSAGRGIPCRRTIPRGSSRALS